MRILEHPQLLRIVAAADRELHRIRARRLQDGKLSAAGSEAAFALAKAVGADADVGRVERAGPELDALGRCIAQVPVHTMDSWRLRHVVQGPDGLAVRVLNGDRRAAPG